MTTTADYFRICVLLQPVTGLLIAELIAEGQARSVDIRPFDPARFMGQKGGGRRERKMGVTEVGEQW